MSLTEISFHSVYEKDEQNIKKLCLQLCKSYLTKEWQNVSLNDLIFYQIVAGFSNITYFCSIPETLVTHNIESKEVIIKFYGDYKTNTVDKQLQVQYRDVINSLFFSMNGLSPKVYGFFTCGQIQEYFKSRWFDIEEQKNSELVTKLAKLLAIIHSLKPPVSKICQPYYERLKDVYNYRNQRYNINELKSQSKCKELLDTDLVSEIDWLKSVVLLADSPVVFSHSDFWGPNILVGDSNDIKVCDLEYSRYETRAKDFGCLFNFWDRKLMDFSEPMSHRLVSDSDLKFFFQNYRQEMIEINGEDYGNNNKNSINKLIFETKLYILVLRFFYYLVGIELKEEVNTPNVKSHIASRNFNIATYFLLKRQLIDENLIQDNY